MIAKSVIQFIKQCPYIKNGTFCADCLSSKPYHYTVEAVPSTQILKTYCDGASVRQFSFVFASREYYGTDELINLSNNGFYENFSNWLEECTKNGNLPDLGEKAVPIGIEAQSVGYMYEASGNTARYQIQCRLIYYKEA